MEDPGFRFDFVDVPMYRSLVYAVRRSLIEERSVLMQEETSGKDYFPLQLIFAIGHLGRALGCMDQYLQEMRHGQDRP